MKILFTSVGRRVELVQVFHRAAKELDIDLTVIGADVSETAPALYFCDERNIVCRINNPEYIPQLLEICQKNKVDCLIPTIDTDLILLSENKKHFENIGTKVFVSELDKVRLCRDKNQTAVYFESIGLKTPYSVDSVEKYENAVRNKKCSFPAFIKPKDGSSSIDAYQADSLDNLKVYANKIESYVIQSYISGREFTIDIFCDYEGNPIYITPRERLAVRSGEVLKTRIFQDNTMINEMKKLIADYKPCGQITVQLIRDEKSGDDYYIEINPRFGGGAPLSIYAGADSAKAVLKILNGEKLHYYEKAAKDGAIYSRFDQSVCVKEGKREIKGVIFDLDDTLYSEKEYVKSGFRVVSDYLGGGYDEKLWQYFEDNKIAITELLRKEGRMEEEKKCLEIYRNHMPDIHLYSGVVEMMNNLKSQGFKIGIITDGRPKGQRNKLKVLGLESLVDDIIITDELGGTQFRKPCDIAFRIMITRWRMDPSEVVYVADNINKDFQAPKQLGMKSLWFRNEDGLYTFDTCSDLHHVEDISECLGVLRQIGLSHEN